MEDDENDTRRSPRLGLGSDAHGQAALLLVESMLHGLVARSVLTVGDAVEMVDIAADAKAEIAIEIGEASAVTEKALTLLAAIGTSLRNDLPD